jgi:hypothetical protein
LYGSVPTLYNPVTSRLRETKKIIIAWETRNQMILTIYFKNGTGSKDGHTYYFSEEEYRNFSRDFEAYLTTGMPRGGKYPCQEHDEHGEQLPIQALIVEFAAIAFVDLKISMARIANRARLIELAKRRVGEDVSNKH